MYKAGNKCFIGLEGIPDKYNQIRLGTVFLRNFYTVLDYDNNLIALGLNLQGSAAETATINGKGGASSPAQSSGGGLLGFLLIVFFLGGGIYAFLYWKKKQTAKQLFAKTTVKKEV